MDARWRTLVVLLAIVTVAAVALAAKECPSCGTSNRDDARFCKSCGYGFPRVVTPALPSLRVSVTVVPGLVEITSEPSGAAVVVKGARLGVTPFASGALGPGRHEFELEFSGYRTYRGSFVVARLQGRIVVRSVPAGAEALLDGVSRGTVPDTGLAIPNLALADYTVVVRMAGYVDEVRSVRLSAEQPTGIVSADLKPREGFLKVASVPDRASVYLNGAEAGLTEFLTGMRPDRYGLRVARRGFYDWLSYAEVRPGETTAVFVSLERMPAKKPAFLITGLAVAAGGGVAAVLGELSYRRYVEAVPPAYAPAEIEQLRLETERYDLIRNVALGVGALGIGAYIVF